MRISVDKAVTIFILTIVIAIIAAATIMIPMEMRQRKEFNAKCKLHDGIVYRTRDGSICLKKDSVITNL